MEHKYKNDLNFKNIETISRWSIKKILKTESTKDREIFLHGLAAKWIFNSELSDDVLFTKLKKIIRKTRIILSDIENHKLFILEERAFSIDRHIKDILVNIKLRKKESVGAKFVKAKLFSQKRKLKLIEKGDLLISNKRIILVFEEEITSFDFFKMLEYEYKEFGFYFKLKTGQKYLIRIHDQEALNNTLANLISKKVKTAIKKEIKN